MITEGELSDQRSAFSDISKLTDHVSVHCQFIILGAFDRMARECPNSLDCHRPGKFTQHIQNLKWPPRVI